MVPSLPGDGPLPSPGGHFTARVSQTACRDVTLTRHTSVVSHETGKTSPIRETPVCFNLLRTYSLLLGSIKGGRLFCTGLLTQMAKDRVSRGAGVRPAGFGGEHVATDRTHPDEARGESSRPRGAWGSDGPQRRAASDALEAKALALLFSHGEAPHCT